MAITPIPGAGAAASAIPGAGAGSMMGGGGLMSLLSGLFGGGGGGSPQPQQPQDQQQPWERLNPMTMGLLGLGGGMLGAAGPSRTPVGFGQGMTQGMMGGLSGMMSANMLNRQSERDSIVDQILRKQLEMAGGSDISGPLPMGGMMPGQRVTPLPMPQMLPIEGSVTPISGAMRPGMPGQGAMPISMAMRPPLGMVG